MGTNICTDSMVSSCDNWYDGETLCTDEGLLQVVYKRKERMTRCQTTQQQRRSSTAPDGIPLFETIPDDITIDHILTKVHWRLLTTLATLNREWYHAIRSGKVYNARVRMHATQTLIIISHLAAAPLNIGAPPTAISAYDPSTDEWHLLPPIPSSRVSCDVLPQLRGVVCLKARLYIVTGSEVTGSRSVPRNEVFVLDFGTAARRWSKCRCSSDSSSPKSYGAVRDVEDGKICVWGSVQI